MTPEGRAALEALGRVIAGTVVEEIPEIRGELARLDTAALGKMLALTAVPPRLEVGAQTDERLLGAPEISDVLGVPVGQVREMMRRSELPVIPVGKKYRRVRWSSLMEWIAQHEERTLDRPGYMLYSRANPGVQNDRRAAAGHPKAAGPHPGGAGRTARRHAQYRSQVGAQRGAHKRAGGKAGEVAGSADQPQS